MRTGKDYEPPEEDDDDDGKKKGGKKKKKSAGAAKKRKEEEEKKMFSCKIHGDFMKSFPSFYDNKSLEPELGEKQVAKLESKITKECEYAIKQVRSSKNLNANIKNNHMTRTILKKYLDYVEDVECLRLDNPKQEKITVFKELMKLTPPNYKITMLPAFFNHTDGERIATVIRDTSQDFLVGTPKKVLFSIGVKIFPYASEINSIRIVLVKFFELPEGAAEDGAAGSASKSKKSKSRSGKSKSGSQKGDKEAPQDAPPTKS